MKTKLLIGYDGSDCAKAAIDDLRHAGLPPDAEASVLSVADVWQPPAREPGDPAKPDEALPDVVKAARAVAHQAMVDAAALAAEGAARVRAWFPDWTVTAESRASSPYWALIDRADQWRPDLVVIGSHGRSAFGRLVLGSVSQKVVEHAACSVRVSRRSGPVSDEARRPVRVLVGVDGSPESAAAVQAVALRNWPPGSQAMVVVASDLRMTTAAISLFQPFGPVIDTSQLATGPSWPRRAAERAARELREAGLTVTAVVREGDPKRVLVREAEEWHADTVFVGAQGLGRLDRFLIGSVSSAVAARAHCSVEVVRHG